ncbi:hypothetical protein FQZ97_906850 [compost metagenome]
MVIQQPAQENLDFLDFGGLDIEFRTAQPGQQFLGLGLHRLKIGDAQAHFGKDFMQGFFQGSQLAGAGATVDLQEHQRFLQHALALAALGQDF